MIKDIPFLPIFLKSDSPLDRRTLRAIGWGSKPSGQRARAYAQRHGVQAQYLEDGFLRSFGTGDMFPPLSLVVDQQGIYYDCTRPSDLETLLNSATTLLNESNRADVLRAKALILTHQLSKYNHAPALDPQCLRRDDQERILVVDQTEGDLSVLLGGADATSFETMLKTARTRHPDATIYVKTHPEVSSGRKRGYLTHIQNDDRTVVLRDAINPLSLLVAMDRVYTVSSIMGFEALLANKPVHCFGMPWYAGWGATEDEQRCTRRTRQRSVDELFAAAYLQYTRYLNPQTRQLGTIFDVIDWLCQQKHHHTRYGTGRMIAIGFRSWKARHTRPFLGLLPARVHFVKHARSAKKLAPTQNDHLVVWGAKDQRELSQLAQESGATLLRMEDGFMRSVGLGSDLIRPRSLILDRQGIYFNPTTPSELETLLQTHTFSDDDIRLAQRVRHFIVEHALTKYNIDPMETPSWYHTHPHIVLVPGQVEDDASILWGCTQVKTNLGLLQAARAAHPDAFIVYKPHPDVMSGNRQGHIKDATQYADAIETKLSIISCINAAHEIHTMTSLSGFDALLRGKHVVTYGQPFYAGWGLTEDKAVDGIAFTRRTRCLRLDELVAGSLLHAPIYWDWELKGYTTCLAVLEQLLEERTVLTQTGRLHTLKHGIVRRVLRKVAELVKGGG